VILINKFFLNPTEIYETEMQKRLSVQAKKASYDLKERQYSFQLNVFCTMLS